jgi:hypothetical protein
MPRYIKKSLKKAGSAPGTLVHVGEKDPTQLPYR